ncbi:MAG TPA: M23 family metallopeptidase [Magnetospirillum sp.]|jgi:hypothetical protein|nr:M23 family metallopeptidase [Magnetospirillum sp.]
MAGRHEDPPPPSIEDTAGIARVAEPPVLIAPPVRGLWAIMNPPGHARLAFDFLAVDERKSPYRKASLWQALFRALPVEATHAWGQPVFAPADGVVVTACDGMPDRKDFSLIRDLLRLMLFGPRRGAAFSAYGGNHVILKCGDIYPLFAHLRQGSVAVAVGDTVRSGDRLGQVGNSGCSLQPHLHFQVMRDPNPFPLFKNLVPFVVTTFHRCRRGEWRGCAESALANGHHLRL